MTTLAPRPTTPLDGPPAPTGPTGPAGDERLRDLLRRRVPDRSLPGECYTDPALYAREISGLWQRQWVFVGSVAEVPEAGDYLTVDLGPASVMVLRDDEERVRAFRNVCRHRGARLLTEPRGSVGNIVCGYHTWTYGTDGSLRYAPTMPPETDTSCLGLRSVHVREIGGLLFCCLAPEPPEDLDEVAARLTPYLAPHALHRAKVAAQVDLVEGGNWKLVLENNRECYHCGSHAELSCTFFPTWGLEPEQVPARLRPAHERYLAAEEDLHRACAERGMPCAPLEELTGRPFGHRIQREALDGRGESFSLDGTRLVRRLLGDLDEPRLGRATLHAQPNLWAHFLADHVVTFAALPLGPDRTLVRTTWLVDADAVEGEDYDVEALTEVWRRTNEQDADFVALTQRGVADPGFEPGPYAQGERQVDAFVTWYVERMLAELGDPSEEGSR